MNAIKIDLIMLSIQKTVIWLTNNILIVSILVMIIYLANFPLYSRSGVKKETCGESKVGNGRDNCSWLKQEVEG